MKKLALTLAALMTATVLLTGCTLTSGGAESAETTTAAEIATTAPEATAETTETEAKSELTFSLTTLTGETIDDSIISDHKLTMVNFWATWCGPCVSEIPDLVQLSEDYADQGFQMIGVLTGDDDVEGAIAFLEEQGVSYPVVQTEGVFLDMAQSIYAIPTTMFFDENGKQVGNTIVGANSYADWAAKIELLLSTVG